MRLTATYSDFGMRRHVVAPPALAGDWPLSRATSANG